MMPEQMPINSQRDDEEKEMTADECLIKKQAEDIQLLAEKLKEVVSDPFPYATYSKDIEEYVELANRFIDKK